MTKAEFSKIIAYLALAIGKPLSAESTEVYYDLLGDLDPIVFLNAAKRVVLEHPWSTFPSVAELRSAAISSSQGTLTPISPAEAWELAWRAAGGIDLDISGSCERRCKNLPPLVYRAMCAYGIASLVNGKEPVMAVRAQFMKIYEQFQARSFRESLMPANLKAEIGRLADHCVPPPENQNHEDKRLEFVGEIERRQA